ncbi:GGGtGRT protein [Ruminococcus bicirculans (ex Wegman et al. 2014)]
MIRYDKIQAICMGNNPMVGATVACAVAVEEAMK